MGRSGISALLGLVTLLVAVLVLPTQVVAWASVVLLFATGPGSIFWGCRVSRRLDARLFWIPVGLALTLATAVSALTTWRLADGLDPNEPLRTAIVAVSLMCAALAVVAAFGPSARHAAAFRVLGAGELAAVGISVEIWVVLLLTGGGDEVSARLVTALHVASLVALSAAFLQIRRATDRPEGLGAMSWLGVSLLAASVTRVAVDLDADPRVYALSRVLIGAAVLMSVQQPDASRLGRFAGLDRGPSPVSAWRRTMVLLLLVNAVFAFEFAIGRGSRLASIIAVTVLGAVVIAESLRGVKTSMALSEAPTVGRQSDSLLHEELAAAIADHELDLHYQPIVDVGSNVVVGAEALLRWNHGRGLDLSPQMIIAVATSGGFVDDLESWILMRALGDTQTVADSITTAGVGVDPGIVPSAFVSINIAVSQLGAPGFATSFLERAEARGVDASALTLELTEHGRLEDWEAAAAAIDELRQAGVSVALDDFGSGLANVEMLSRLPFDLVKLDRTFALDAGRPDRRALLETSVHAVRSLDVKLLLEGVEMKDATWSQELLPLVDLVQGHAYGVPMPLDEFVDAMVSGRRGVGNQGLEVQIEDSIASKMA